MRATARLTFIIGTQQVELLVIWEASSRGSTILRVFPCLAMFCKEVVQSCCMGIRATGEVKLAKLRSGYQGNWKPAQTCSMAVQKTPTEAGELVGCR